ncbi:MAG: hypothetical protein IJ688_05080 [Treponema sp.]|nr:hypothetical protein [Treponema sp.]
MKKTLIFTCGFLIFAALFSSCATLQQDIYVDSSENAVIFSSIEEYENLFIMIDVKDCIEKSVPASQINSLIKQIDTYSSSVTITEPAVLARLTALRGLLNVISGKVSAAQTDFAAARKLQAGDWYVLLLGSRLEKSQEDSLNRIDLLLRGDSKNYVLQMEQGKILYKMGRYADSVAAFDNAFLLLGNSESSYRSAYSQLRDYVWNLYSVSGRGADSESLSVNLTEILTLEDMVNLTRSNTSLLESLSGKAALNNRQKKELIERLDFTDGNYDFSTPVSRSLCARFIWKLYVNALGDKSLATKYSDRYKKSGRTKSPVADVSSDNPDFDAVLGMIENEFMDLPDGRNFFPQQSLSRLEFLTAIQKADARVNGE